MVNRIQPDSASTAANPGMAGNRLRGTPETVNDSGTVTKPPATERLRGVGYNGMFIEVGSYWFLKVGIFSLIEFD